MRGDCKLICMIIETRYIVTDQSPVQARKHKVFIFVLFSKALYLPCLAFYVYLHVLMRDEKEGRKKQARSD